MKLTAGLKICTIKDGKCGVNSSAQDSDCDNSIPVYNYKSASSLQKKTLQNPVQNPLRLNSFNWIKRFLSLNVERSRTFFYMEIVTPGLPITKWKSSVWNKFDMLHLLTFFFGLAKLEPILEACDNQSAANEERCINSCLASLTVKAFIILWNISISDYRVSFICI